MMRLAILKTSCDCPLDLLRTIRILFSGKENWKIKSMFNKEEARYVRINGTGSAWFSMFEVRAFSGCEARAPEPARSPKVLARA